MTRIQVTFDLDISQKTLVLVFKGDPSRAARSVLGFTLKGSSMKKKIHNIRGEVREATDAPIKEVSA